MIALMNQAASRGAQLIVFPELALTTFFHVGGSKIKRFDHMFEREMPNEDVLPLFETSKLIC